MSQALPEFLQTAAASGDLVAALDAALAHFGCQAGTVHLMNAGVLKLAAHRNIPPPVVQIVELHDGRIEAHSEGPGMGAEFIVFLPLLRHAWPAAAGE